MSDPVEVLLGAGAALAVIFLAGWLVSLATRDASWADVVWGLCFVAVAWVTRALGDGGDLGLLAAILASVWGLRLASYIGRRKLREGEEDRRYREMRERHGARFARRSLVSVFGLQAAVAWIVALPLAAVALHDDGIGALALAGSATWLVGFGFEAIGDAQLVRFKRNHPEGGGVMDRGLWRYTRHPNYFGDVLVWLGLALIALEAGAWWALLSPVLMAYLLVRVTGKEMTERHLSRREGYADYVERTSGFVPLPPRRPRTR